MALSIKEKQIIAEMRAQHPEMLQYSDEQILSIYNDSLNNIHPSQDEIISAFSGQQSTSDNTGFDSLQKGNKKLNKDKEQALLAKLKTKISKINEETEKAESESSVTGHIWSWMKNNVPLLDKITDSSNEVRRQGKLEQKILDEVSSGKKTLEEAFVEITGIDFNEENINKFLDDRVEERTK